MQLVFEQGPLVGRQVPLPQGELVLGRGEGSDLLLPETGVSRRHARLQPGPQGWLVIDLGSTNGTYVNGRRLVPERPHLLRSGDRIAIGSSILVLQSEDASGGVAEGPLAEAPAQRRPHPALLAMGAIGLVVVLVGLVILLVMLLQPEPAPVTPTVAGPLEQIATAFPVPTELQGVMTSVAPMLPTGLPFLPLGATSTPTPEAAWPEQEKAHIYLMRAQDAPLSRPKTKDG